jgi:hypothetical protein
MMSVRVPGLPVPAVRLRRVSACTVHGAAAACGQAGWYWVGARPRTDGGSSERSPTAAERGAVAIHGAVLPGCFECGGQGSEGASYGATGRPRMHAPSEGPVASPPQVTSESDGAGRPSLTFYEHR